MLRPLFHVVACCWELLHRLHNTAAGSQQHATMLVQQYWELLRPFARSFKVGATRKIIKIW